MNENDPGMPDDILLFDVSIERYPEDQACPEWAVGAGGGHERATALIAAIDHFLSSGCPIHPEPLRLEPDAPIQGTFSAGVNCPICNSNY